MASSSSKPPSPEPSTAIISMTTSEPEANVEPAAAPNAPPPSKEAEIFSEEQIQKFLADAWHSLMIRDNSNIESQEVDDDNADFTSPHPPPQSGSNKGKGVASSADKDDEEAELATPRRRGRPVSNLDWLPDGWIRFTRPRENGQTDTIGTNRTMRSSYDVLCFMEFGKVIKKDKEQTKQILEAKYELKFPKEKRRRSAPPSLEAATPVASGDPAGAEQPPSGDEICVALPAFPLLPEQSEGAPAAVHGSPANGAADDAVKKEAEEDDQEPSSHAVDMEE
ncbi:hypothetical protein AXF42_Ash014894 [Apostasia shenzhenica]|uniref:Uncharacterized protein n=1 Tax=Apostasia shenzhenica TaxID=1088818 RepID=A0A2I0ALF6_9ASPA|nr:hypothetical protein AXF42_Ash014894 [Apostasia shenzhenica]